MAESSHLGDLCLRPKTEQKQAESSGDMDIDDASQPVDAQHTGASRPPNAGDYAMQDARLVGADVMAEIDKLSKEVAKLKDAQSKIGARVQTLEDARASIGTQVQSLVQTHLTEVYDLQRKLDTALEGAKSWSVLAAASAHSSHGKDKQDYEALKKELMDMKKKHDDELADMNRRLQATGPSRVHERLQALEQGCHQLWHAVFHR